MEIIDPETTNMNQHNRRAIDDIIEFLPEGHIYQVKGWLYPYSEWQTSVSTLCKYCIGESFDPFQIARFALQREESAQNYRVPDGPERIARIQAIQASQELGYAKSRDLGTELHDELEKYILSGKLNPEYTPKEYFWIQRALEHKDLADYRPVRTEMRLKDDDLLLCGSLDLLMKHVTKDEYIIVDYKRSKNCARQQKVYDGVAAFAKGQSYSPFPNDERKCCLYPFEHLPKSNFTKYVFQQNIYKYMLEKLTGYNVVNLFLIVLNPDRAKENVIKLPILSKEMDLIVQLRRRQLYYKWHNWAMLKN